MSEQEKAKLLHYMILEIARCDDPIFVIRYNAELERQLNGSRSVTKEPRGLVIPDILKAAFVETWGDDWEQQFSGSIGIIGTEEQAFEISELAVFILTHAREDAVIWVQTRNMAQKLVSRDMPELPEYLAGSLDSLPTPQPA